MRYLSASAILSAVHAGDLLPAVAAGLSALHRHEAVNPPRLVMALPTQGGTVFAMPAFLPALNALTMKYVAVFPDNVRQGRDGTPGLVILADPATGEPAALLDGTVVTRLRTGAVTALATDRMGMADVRVLGMIGAGGQALGIAEGILAVRPHIRRVQVYARAPEHRRRFLDALAARLQGWGEPSLDLRSAPSAEAAVVGADVVVTATSSPTPVLEAGWIAPHAHVNAIGAFRATTAELPAGVFSHATAIAVDAPEAAREEAGDLIQAVAAGTLAWSRVEPLARWLDEDPPPEAPRTGPTVFKSVGVAALDAAVSRFLVDRVSAGVLDLPT